MLEPLKLDLFVCLAVYKAGHALNRVYKPLLDTLGHLGTKRAKRSAASAKSSSWNQAR